jgi:hypothetical protein
MNRAIQFVGVVWLSIGVSLCAAQKPPKNPPPPKAAPAAKPAPQPASNNAGGVPKAGAQMANPSNPVFRLFTMSLEQRERAIEKLPPKQQENIRKTLANFDSKPQAQKDQELQKLNGYWSLPQDKQAMVAQQIKAFKALSPDRLPVVRQAYRNLSSMTPEQRADRLSRPQFRSRFTNSSSLRKACRSLRKLALQQGYIPETMPECISRRRFRNEE